MLMISCVPQADWFNFRNFHFSMQVGNMQLFRELKYIVFVCLRLVRRRFTPAWLVAWRLPHRWLTDSLAGIRI